MISVVVPTRNRHELLALALEHIVTAAVPDIDFEVIVIDNSSRDETPRTAERFKDKFRNFRYIKNNSPFLVDGRHKGLDAASGDVTVFIDDDSFVSPSWLAATLDSFSDESVGISGGPCVPEYEVPPPRWLEVFKGYCLHGYMAGPLSLLELDYNKKAFVPPTLVFGCNFAIRTELAIRAGGFNPDGVPDRLLYLRGDGETALACRVFQDGGKVIYNPLQKIKHFVSRDRLTLGYMARRSFCEGVTANFRKRRGEKFEFPSFPGLVFESKNQIDMPEVPLAMIVKAAREAGEYYHEICLKKAPELLDYVKAPDFMKERKYPELDSIEKREFSDNSGINEDIDRAAVLASWKAVVAGMKMKPLLFGAGRHTVWLVDLLKNNGLPLPEKIIDENPAGRVIGGIKVEAPEDVSVKPDSVIFLSTKVYAEMFRKRCVELFGGNVKLIEFY